MDAYSESGTGWVDQMKASFDDKKDKLIFSRGNHDEDESESKQTQEDIEAWFPAAKGIGFEDTWLTAKQVGNVYVISMDTQDLDIEFKRDQFNWVQSELVKAKDLRAAGTIDWIIILFHKPFFTLKSSHSPYTAVRFLYKELFRDAQVDFCVSGHNHNTQLWLPMVPNDSEANGEGQQLFTKLPDGTFDFTKDHGAAFIVTGHAGHEWNSISDSGGGVANVQHYRDDGKYGYTVIETTGKTAKVLSKDVDNATTFEYKVSRGGGVIVEPPDCPDPAKCKDPQTGECRPIGVNEHKSPTDGSCQQNTTPQPGGTICPRDYHFDQSLQKCIPDLEPQLNPICPAGTTWNGSVCVGTVTPPCPDNQCKDLTTGLCRPIGPDEFKDPFGACKPKPTVICPDGQCKDVSSGLCRAIGADEERDVNGFCKTKTPQPGGDWVLDSNGVGWSPDTTGETVGIEMSRDEATDDRWSGNVTGLRNGFEATFIGKSMETSGDAHFAMKQFGGNHSGSGASSQRWYDNGLRQDGTVQLQWEGPHPSNHDYELPDTKQPIKKISKGLEGNWIGLKWRCETVTPNGSPANGGVRVRMWVDEDPLDATTNKPKNGWKPVLDFIDGVDVQVINPQDYEAPDEQDCEVRRSDTGKHEIYSNGQIVEAKEGVVGLYVRHLS